MTNSSFQNIYLSRGGVLITFYVSGQQDDQCWESMCFGNWISEIIQSLLLFIIQLFVLHEYYCDKMGYYSEKMQMKRKHVLSHWQSMTN